MLLAIVARAGSNAIGILMLAQFAVDLIGQSQDATNRGHYYDFFGQLIITDLAVAAQNLPRGVRLQYRGVMFINTGTGWLSADPTCFMCRLEADEKGIPTIVGGTRCCD